MLTTCGSEDTVYFGDCGIQCMPVSPLSDCFFALPKFDATVTVTVTLLFFYNIFLEVSLSKCVTPGKKGEMFTQICLWLHHTLSVWYCYELTILLLLWTHAQRASMLYFAHVFYIYIFLWAP